MEQSQCPGCRERDARIAALAERVAELEGRINDLTKTPLPPRPGAALPKGPAKSMNRSLALRPLRKDEIQQLKAGLRSSRGFTVRRSQILLARAKGFTPTQIASVVGCGQFTVTKVIREFHARGIVYLRESQHLVGPHRPGRPSIEEREPGITIALERLLQDEIAGDPMGGATWVRSSLRKLAKALSSRSSAVGVLLLADREGVLDRLVLVP